MCKQERVFYRQADEGVDTGTVPTPCWVLGSKGLTCQPSVNMGDWGRAHSDVTQLGGERIHGLCTDLLVCQQVSADAPRIVCTAIVKPSGMFICDSKNVVFPTHRVESTTKCAYAQSFLHTGA